MMMRQEGLRGTDAVIAVVDVPADVTVDVTVDVPVVALT